MKLSCSSSFHTVFQKDNATIELSLHDLVLAVKAHSFSIRETEHDSSTHWSLDYCMIIHKRQSITITLLTKKVISLLYRLGVGMLKASLLESFLVRVSTLLKHVMFAVTAFFALGNFRILI